MWKWKPVSGAENLKNTIVLYILTLLLGIDAQERLMLFTAFPETQDFIPIAI